MEDASYQITCSKEQFEQLRTDDSFLYLLMLGRVINALHFCHKAGIDARDDPSPAGARSRMNSFLFAASVLYEAFPLIERMGRFFKDTESFQNSFKPLLRDQKVSKFRSTVLNRARNKLVFHFDEGSVKESLTDFELPQYIFATGIGEASGGMVFQLSEEVVINYLLKPDHNDNDNTLRQRYEFIIGDTIGITGRFIEASESLMGEVLRGMGFTIEYGQRQIP